MEVLVVILFTALVIISLIPTTEDEKRFYNDSKALNHCEITHSWEKKEEYLVCSKCKYIPSTGNYEEELPTRLKKSEKDDLP